MYATTVYSLIARDYRVFKEDFVGKFIDQCIMLSTTVVIFSYFLPSYGLASDYGPFVLAGVIGSFGFFDVMGKVAQTVADIEGDRTVMYTISLPIPSWLVFFYMGLSWAIFSAITCALLFPLGKLLLFSQFDLGKVHYIKLVLIFFMSNLFFGFFSLWLSSIIKKMSSISHLFVRIINPMFMFGGYLYSWNAVYEMSHIGGYLSLLNPLIYVMEGIRSAILSPQGYLPFWISFAALIGFTVVLGYDAVVRLKKRLDCV